MHIPVLIEPIAGGRFRARSGEPFGAAAEADSADEARKQLETILRHRLNGGPLVATVDLGNGSEQRQPPLQLPPVPENDWFFDTMRDAIAENRAHEDEAGS